MNTPRYLSVRDVSDHTGVAHDTIKSLIARGKFPTPDVQIGLGDGQRTVRGWKLATIDTWLHGYAPQARRSPGEND